jgi:acyl-CoA thioester hydrolase
MTDPFRYFLRVRYGECDAQHVVYNPKYGEYFDLAATEFMRTAFAPLSVFGGTFEFQVVKLVVEWKAPAVLDDVLEIRVQPTRFGTTSFTLGFEIHVAGRDGPIVSGETINVHAARIDGAWRKAAIPPDLRARLETAAAGKVVDHAGRATAS